jgi:hypothetical protein
LPARKVTPQQVFARVAMETGLLGETFHRKKSLAPLVSALCGIRCERLEPAHLALAARLPDYQPQVLLRSLQERRAIVRTWGARGLLQIVPAAEIPTYLAAAGLTAPRWKRFLDARSNLSNTTRLRLLKRLCPEDISRDALREAIPDATTRLFMLREAAQAGHILWKDGDGPQVVFAWTKDWLGHKLEVTHDFQGLVEKFVRRYGPVEAADLAAWLGVTVAAARKLMSKHRVEEVQVEGESTPSFMTPEDLEDLVRIRKSQTRGLVVIPPGDPFLLAYKTRYHGHEPEGAQEGIVVADGRVVAAWSLARTGAPVRFLAEGSHARILKAIQGVLSRAAVELEAVPEDKLPNP